jgi:hypothetical protein
MPTDPQDFCRSLFRSPTYQAHLIADLKAGNCPKRIVRLLQQYAQRMNAEARAFARTVLTEAGVFTQRSKRDASDQG